MRPFNHRRIRLGLLLGAGFSSLTVLYSFPPTQYSIYPRCPFYSVTHLLCPGCGGTRAVYELLHLNLPGALHYNALVTVLAPLALAWLLWGFYRSYLDGYFPLVPWPRATALGLGTVAIAFALVRDTGIAFVL